MNKICGNCNWPGHTVDECTFDSDEELPALVHEKLLVSTPDLFEEDFCIYCKHTGHRKEHCPTLRKPTLSVKEKEDSTSNRTGTGSKEVECLGCEQTGHSVLYCPGKPVRRKLQLRKGATFNCFHCGTPGHKTINCPKKQD